MYREGDSIKLQGLKSQESSLNEEMKASVDFGWQKKKEKNCMTPRQVKEMHIGFTTRNTSHQKYEEVKKKGVPGLPHNCRINHRGSSKSMEVLATVQLFSKGGYRVLIGDDDSSVISRI